MRREGKESEKTFEEIVAENAPDLIKDMSLQTWEAQYTPRRIFKKRSIARAIWIVKTQRQREHFESSKREETPWIQVILSKIKSWLLYLAKLSLKNEDKIKTLSDKSWENLLPVHLPYKKYFRLKQKDTRQ